MNTPIAPISTTPTTTITPWPKRKLRGIPVWAIVAAGAAIFLIGGYILGQPKRDRLDKIGQVPVCEAMADPANADLTARDWWRTYDNSTSLELIDYVDDHCPEHLDQVSNLRPSR